ncbi:MAG: DUF7933 domain-containing protein [Pseudomarimonas sp.]
MRTVPRQLVRRSLGLLLIQPGSRAVAGVAAILTKPGSGRTTMSSIVARLGALLFAAAGATQAADVAPRGAGLACPTQNFDSVTSPALPAGWSFAPAANNTGPSTFTTTTSAADSAPNAAFTPIEFETSGINDVALVTPEFVPAAGTALSFRHRWRMKVSSLTTTTATRFDGGVLEVSINGAAWQDIEAAGGAFSEGGYGTGNPNNTRIVSSGVPASPIANRLAWSGSSAGPNTFGDPTFNFVTSTAVLPPASVGQSTRLRFRSVQAVRISTAATQFPAPGWWIDSVACVTAPPLLTQAFTPTNTPVNTPTTLTLSLSYPSGGATLTANLVNTLPAGLVVAAAPNASTSCGSTVSAVAGSGSFALAAGAQIPVAGCSVSVDLVASAPAIYVNSLAAAALMTSAGNNPNPTTANYQALLNGVPTYGTSFEEGSGSPTPYPNGAADGTTQNLNGKDGWLSIGGILNNTRVRNVNPRVGAQHARVTPITPHGNGYQGFRSKQFPAGTTDFSVARMSVALQSLAQPPTPAPFDVIAQDLDEATGDASVNIARLRFAGAITDPPFSATGPIIGLDQSIQVEDALSGGFIDTGLDWTSSASYREVSIVTRRSDSAVLICLDGNPIHIGTGAAPDLRSVQFAVQRQNGAGSNSAGAATNNIYDVDAVSIENTNNNHCGSTPGPTAPTVSKVYAQSSVQIASDIQTTITLRNWNDAPITLSADFVDSLPAGIVASAASTTCGGSASFSANTLVLGNGASIPARGSCTLAGIVRAEQTGNFVDGIAAGDLQTNAGSNFNAPAATLAVTEVLVPPIATTLFAPPNVLVGANSSLRVVLRNPNFSPIVLTADLVNNLAPGLQISAVSTTCGGSASFNASSMRLASGATIPGQNGVCSLIGTVQSPTVGQFINTLVPGDLQTSAGSNAEGSSDTLFVTSMTSNSVRLDRTVGTDLSPNACGSDKVLTVLARTSVNFCYRMTNNTDQPLSYQTVNSATFGAVLRYENVVIAPGATYQFNDIRTVATDIVDSATWNSDDALAAYVIETNPAGLAWDDISNTGAIFVNDASSSTIPFAFRFFGEAQTELDMLDGGLAFGRGSASFAFANTILPAPNQSMANTVLPYWDNWSSGASADGALYWQVKGTAPNRRLITQWHNRRFGVAQPNPMRYQAVLFEATGQIAFVYNQVDTGISDPGNTLFQYGFGRSATIGLNFDPSRAALHSYFPEAPSIAPTPVVGNGDSLRFTPTPQVRFSDGDTVGVLVVSPIAVVDTSPIAMQVGEGASASRNLTIGNSGTTNLLWQLDPTLTSRNHLPPGEQSWPSRAALRVNPQGRFDAGEAGRSQGVDVPGYAYTLSASAFGLVSFDVEQPNTLTPIANYPRQADFDVTGLEFVGDDFSKAYTLAFSNGAMHTLDTTTGAATLIGYAEANHSGSEEARFDLAYDPITTRLYAITRQTSPAQLNLYTINPQTAISTYMATLSGPGATGVINAIGINSQGQMFGIDITSDRLVAIDKVTGDTAVVGPLGFNANSDQTLEYDDETDTMYWIGGAGPQPIYSVFRVDTETGAATLVGNGDFGPTPISVGTSGVAIAANHPCMLPAQVSWLTLSDTSGVVGPTDTDTVQIGFNAAGLASGMYSALLCLSSNDPAKPRLRIDLSMAVRGGMIFGDGFGD